MFLKTWVEKTSITTAQLEFKHALHKHMTRSKSVVWHTYAARAVNEQAVEALGMARDSCEAVLAAAGALEEDGGPPDAASVPASSDHSSRRGSSALRVFYRFCVQRDQRLGKTGAWISKEYWAEVKKQWDELCKDDPLYKWCVEESSLSKADAANRRALDRAESKAKRRRGQGREAAQMSLAVVGAGGLRDSLAIVPSSAARSHQFLLPGAGSADGPSVSAPLPLDGDAWKYPLGVDCVAHEVEAARVQTSNVVHDFEKKFLQRVSHVARRGGEPLPLVDYSQACGSICATQHPELCVMQSHLIKQFEALLRSLGKAPHVLLRTCIFEGVGEAVPPTVMYSYVPCCALSAGSHRFRMNIIACSVVAQATCDCVSQRVFGPIDRD